MPFIINDDQKQHLSLPLDTWSKIDSDRLSFSSDGSLIPLSGFLNQVFLNFYSSAKASVAQKLISTSTLIYSMLNDTPLSNNSIMLKTVQHKLVKGLTSDLQIYKRKELENEGRKYRLSNEIKKILESSPESNYYQTAGLYLRAIFIEYSNLPFFERELIFYKKTIELIKQAINEKCMLVIETKNRDYPVRCAPYDIVRDQSDTFHYLIAFELTKTETTCIIRSYRISRLSSVKIRFLERSFITAKLKKQAEVLKAKQDVSFFSDFLIDVDVRLTEKGYKKYIEQIRQRPNITATIDKEQHIYRFKCSYTQALYYFYKFGEDVEIISPSSLRQKFAKSHKNASDIYN